MAQHPVCAFADCTETNAEDEGPEVECDFDPTLICPVCKDVLTEPPMHFGHISSPHVGCFMCISCDRRHSEDYARRTGRWPGSSGQNLDNGNVDASDAVPYITAPPYHCPVCGLAVDPDLLPTRPDPLLGEVLAAQQNSDDVVMCANCDDGQPSPATVHCVNCDLQLCDDCRTITHAAKIFKSHNIVHVNEVPKRKSSRSTHCPKHDKELQLYNFETREMLCLDCYFQDNSQQSQANCMELDRAEPAVRQFVNNYVRSMKAIHGKFVSALTYDSKELEDMVERVEKKEQEFCGLVEKVMQAVHSACEGAKKKVMRELEAWREANDEQANFFEKSKPQLCAIKALVVHCTQATTPLDYLQMQRVLQPRLIQFREDAAMQLKNSESARQIEEPDVVEVIREGLVDILRLHELSPLHRAKNMDVAATMRATLNPSKPGMDYDISGDDTETIDNSSSSDSGGSAVTDDITMSLDTNVTHIQKLKADLKHKVLKKSTASPCALAEQQPSILAVTTTPAITSPAPLVTATSLNHDQCRPTLSDVSSFERSINELRARVKKLVALLVYCHCDVSQRRVSPDLSRFEKLGILSKSIQDGLTDLKEQLELRNSPIGDSTLSKHKMMIEKLEQDINDADAGWRKLFAFAKSIGSISSRISSRSVELDRYETQDCHMRIVEAIGSLDPDHDARLDAINRAMLARRHAQIRGYTSIDMEDQLAARKAKLKPTTTNRHRPLGSFQATLGRPV